MNSDLKLLFFLPVHLLGAQVTPDVTACPSPKSDRRHMAASSVIGCLGGTGKGQMSGQAMTDCRAGRKPHESKRCSCVYL